MNPNHPEFGINLISGLMLAVAILSICYPWKPTQPLAAGLLHLPLILIPLWISYEALMPEYMNIRADILFIVPLMLVMMILWAAKVARFRKLTKNKAEQVGDGDAEEAV